MIYFIEVRNLVTTLHGNNRHSTWRSVYTEGYVLMENASVKYVEMGIVPIPCVRIVHAPPCVANLGRNTF